MHAPRVPDTLTPAPFADGDEVHIANTTADDADHVDIAQSRLTRVILTGNTFEHLRLTDVIVEDCELSGAVLTGAVLLRVQFLRCRMSGLVAYSSKATDVEMIDCKIDEANFRNVTLEACRLSSCLLPGADFMAATMKDVSFERCDLTGADFSKAKLEAVRLHGSTLERIGGADSLKGAIIGSDQVFALAFPLFAALGIAVNDD
jgi:uncharacterized protein YjbI with pentapeptide repeats